jgi:hypothetical protein
MPRKKREHNSDKIIAKAYYNSKSPGGYAGKRRLKHQLKTKVDKKAIDDWLSKSDTYTLHKPLRKRFKRRKYIVSGIDATWQLDLSDLQKLAKYNNGNKYILIAIDAFSRFAFARPIKSKSGSRITEAFADILSKSKRSPQYVHTDKGKEFLNKEFQSLLKSRNIYHYVTENQEIKASMIERLQRSIKSRLFRLFTHTNSYRYVDDLQNIISSYNRSYHRTIKAKPTDVSYQNQERVWHRLYEDNQTGEPIRFKFRVNDRVRISKYSTVFSRGYLPNWSEEIFTIAEAHNTSPPVYSLKDDSGSKLLGTWYEQELQKVVVRDDVYKIEAILGQRKLNGKTQYLVRWLGYDSTFDSYVDKKDLIKHYNN